jgi:flavin reductase (DIM6/NTAB) family NADH-FMN oxidoreductase RutF
LLTARHDGAENVWPIDWHVPLSLEPQLYGISLGKDGFGSSLIRNSGAFVVHFVPRSWEEKIFFCGSTSGRKVDKFKAAKLLREEATTVNVPRLAEALGFLECQVEQVFDVGDHTFFVGRVTHAENRADAERLHHLDSSLADAAGTFE